MAVYTSAGWPTNADTQLTSALAGMVSGDELQFVSNHTFDHSIQQNLPAGCKITADIYGRVQTITNTDTTSDKWLEMGTNCVVERVDFNFPEGPDTTSPGSGLGSDFPDGRGISMNTDCELVAVKMTGGGVTYFVEGVGKSNVTIRNSFFEGAYIQVAMGNIDNFLYEQNIARNARRDAIKTTINAASLGWVRNSAIRNNLFMDMTDAGDFTGGFNNSIIEDNFTVNIGQDWDLKAIYEYSWQVDNPSLTPVLHDVTIRNNTSHQARSVAVITTIVRGPYTSIINNSNWRTYAPQNITFENQLMIHPPGSTKDKALVDSRYSTDITITNPTIREDTIVNRKVAEARSSILGYGFTEETLGEGPSFDVDRPDEGNFTREKGSFPNPTFASLEPSFGRSALGATTMPTYTAEGSAVLFADDTTFTLADVTYDGTTTTLTGGAGTVSLTEITGTDAVFANNVVTISQPDATNNPTVNGTTNVGMTGRLEQTVTIGGVDFPILSGNLAIDLDLIVNDVITAAGALADQSFTEATGVQTFDVSGDFTGTITGYSINPAVTGVTVSAVGVVSFDTDAMAVQTGTSIVVEASNATKSATSGFSLDILAAVTTPPAIGAPPSEVKTYLSGLINTVGRTSTATLKPHTDLPAGTYTVSGSELTFTGNNETLEDFDFTDFTVWDQGDNNIWQQNVFGRTGTVANTAGVDTHFRLQGTGTDVIDNDFIGYQGRNPLGDEESAAIWQGNGANKVGDIARNLIKHMPQDGIKLTNFDLCEENVLYAFSNTNTQPADYDGATTYAIGDEVMHTTGPGAGTWVAVALVAGTLSHPPTGSVTDSNTEWQNIDPHCDAINIKQNLTSGSIVRRNVVYRDPQDADIPVADRSSMVKMVNSYRIVPDSDATSIYREVLIEENASIGNSPTLTSGPMDIGKDGETSLWEEAVIVRRNLFDDEAGEHGDFVEGVFNWDGGFDWTDLSALTEPAGSVPIGPLTPAITIGTPTVIANDNPTTAVVTENYTSDGTPLLVALKIVSGDTDGTVITAPMLDGSPATLVQSQQHVRTGIWVYQLDNPSSGTITFTATLDTTPRGYSVEFLPCAGADTAGMVGASAATGSSGNVTAINHSLTTLNADSAVVYFGCYQKVDEAATTTGATEIYDDQTGTSDFHDLRTIIAHEDAPTAGAYDCDMTWTTAKTSAGIAVEVKS